MAINEADLHKAQQRLRKVIKYLMETKDELCNDGQAEARDKMGVGVGLLIQGEGYLGGLCMKDENDITVQPLGGGK